MSHGKLKITSFLILMLSGSVVSAVAGFFICAAVINGGFKALGSLRLNEMANRYSPIATILGFFIFETVSLIIYVIIHGEELAEYDSETEEIRDTDKKEKKSVTDRRQVSVSNDDNDVKTAEVDENGFYQAPLPDVDAQYDNAETSEDRTDTDISEDILKQSIEQLSESNQDEKIENAISVENGASDSNISSERLSDNTKEGTHADSEKLAEELSDSMTKAADEYEASIPNDLDYLLGRTTETEKTENISPVVEEKPSENDILSECTLSSDVISKLRENDTYSPEQIMSISRITDYIPASSLSYSFIRKMFSNSLSVDDISDKIVALYG